MGKNYFFVWKFILFAVALTNLAGRANGDDDGVFGIGVGIADVTGPAAEIGMVSS